MILSMFDASGHIKNSFIKAGLPCITLDTHKGVKPNKTDIVTDIMLWDYKQFPTDYFKFMFIALPCQTFSKASGGRHFKKSIPQTPQAYNAILILNRIAMITQYFTCPFMIENPAGGLINNTYFKALFKVHVTRLSQSSFGFPTQKLTDLFYNFNMLLMVPVTHRVNGRYSKQRLNNMSYRQKVTYPKAFTDWLIPQIITALNFKPVQTS